jgi:signal peptide peptidase SppA
MIYAYDTGRGLIARATIRGEIVGGEPDRELIESWEPYAQVDEIARFCDSVREDEDVAGVVLAFDSPGGSVLRLTHAVRAVHALSVAKPTLAYVDERAASAAYWIASQCRAIWAASTLSQVGAIGARQELMSEAGRLERQGVAVETVFRGDGKDVPDSSRAISDADREQVGRLLDPIYDAFVADVAVGRSLTDEQVRAIGARVYPAAEAVEIGLVDDIVPANGLDRTFAERVLGMDAADAAVLAAG